MELRRRRAKEVLARIWRRRSRKSWRGGRSRAQAPRLMPLKTISWWPASERFRISRSMTSGERLRLFPRTNGITQKAQRLLQPSWIFKVGRWGFGCPPGAGAAGASWWAEVAAAGGGAGVAAASGGGGKPGTPERELGAHWG